MSRWVLRPPVESWGELFLGSMENKKTYSELLRSPLWQKKRLKILERDDFTCQYCGCKEKELQVHHRIYHKGAKPWEYDDSELITLCSRCHEIETEEKNYHYETFKDICNLAREIGLSEQFIGVAFAHIYSVLEAISNNELCDNDRFVSNLLLGTCNNKDAEILFERGLSLSKEDLSFLENYWPQLIDIYNKKGKYKDAPVG